MVVELGLQHYVAAAVRATRSFYVVLLNLRFRILNDRPRGSFTIVLEELGVVTCIVWAAT